jgi:hypothetical protein
MSYQRLPSSPNPLLPQEKGEKSLSPWERDLGRGDLSRNLPSSPNPLLLQEKGEKVPLPWERDLGRGHLTRKYYREVEFIKISRSLK